MSGSDIEWTLETKNPGVYGCEMEGPECAHCYAMIMAARQEAMARARGETEGGYIGTTVQRRWTGNVSVDPAQIAPTFAGLRKAPCAVFVTSMADLFHPAVPDSFLDLCFDEMEAREWHWFQVLTKRVENATAYTRRRGRRWPENVWLGATCGAPGRGPERATELVRSPAPHVFLSMEPLLGELDVRPFLPRVSWVIAGGESGAKARPSHPDWMRAVRDQCAEKDVAFFLKQWGELAEVNPETRDPASGEHVTIDPDAEPKRWTAGRSVGVSRDGQVVKSLQTMRPGVAYRHMHRVGRKAAGRALDGVEHLAFPLGWSRTEGRQCPAL